MARRVHHEAEGHQEGHVDHLYGVLSPHNTHEVGERLSGHRGSERHFAGFIPMVHDTVERDHLGAGRKGYPSTYPSTVFPNVNESASGVPQIHGQRVSGKVSRRNRVF